MAGNFLNNYKFMLSNSLKWVSDNIDFYKTKSFVDVHLEGFNSLFEDSTEIEIDILISFINELSSSLDYNGNNIYLALVINICNADNLVKQHEFSLKYSNDNKLIISIENYFTPPSLYLLSNPLDLVLYNYHYIENVSDNSRIHVFKKISKEISFYEISLNFLTLIE